MTELPFSDTEYSKLTHRVFPTVRRRDKYGNVGETVAVSHGEYGDRDQLGHAEIIAKEQRTLESLLTPFLLFDTESSEIDDALDSINEFYQNPIRESEELTLYWLRWTDIEGVSWL